MPQCLYDTKLCTYALNEAGEAKDKWPKRSKSKGLCHTYVAEILEIFCHACTLSARRFTDAEVDLQYTVL